MPGDSQQLYMAINRESSARIALTNGKRTLENVEKQYRYLQAEGNRLQQQLAEAATNINNLQANIADYKRRITNFALQIDSIQAQKIRINNEVRRLRAITQEAAPAEKWGNYCENGHLNCVNLPNVVHRLGNAAEIEAHKNKVARAFQEITLQLNEARQLDARLDELSRSKFSMEKELQNAEIKYSSGYYDVSHLQGQVEQNQQLQDDRIKNYQRAQAEVNRCEEALAAAQTAVTDLQQSQVPYRSSVFPSAATGDDSSYQQMLQAMALQEIREDEEKQSIRRLALQELAEEEAAAANKLIIGIGSELNAEIRELGGVAANTIDHVSAISSSLVDNARHLAQEVRAGASGFLNAAASLYPAHVVMMQAINRTEEEIVGIPPTTTGNPIIDQGYRR